MKRFLLVETAWLLLRKLNTRLLQASEIPTLGTCPKEPKTGTQTSARGRMLTDASAALRAAAKGRKQPKRPSADGWMNCGVLVRWSITQPREGGTDGRTDARSSRGGPGTCAESERPRAAGPVLRGPCGVVCRSRRWIGCPGERGEEVGINHVMGPRFVRGRCSCFGTGCG